jgi:hypothetical protein
MTRGAIEQRELERADTPTYFSLRRNWVTARKAYRCDICGNPIEAGTRYISHALIYDGEFRFWRECGRSECDS